ncbi:DNA-binding response regulator [Chitinispirillum alkaliphilum]|nr:DNA-binding response regulator [Chitinispirillum alkaliphilum]
MLNFDQKIMVIDDDPFILELVSVNLKLRGFTVNSFTSGLDALESYETIKPSLVILDVMMPEMDGWEICKIIKDNDESAKVLMLTAKDTDKDKMIGRSILQADAYVTKPFDLNQLIDTIKHLLES